MTNRNKIKGTKFENKVSKIIWDHLIKCREFQDYVKITEIKTLRDVASGNWKGSVGDLILLPKNIFDWVVECKHWKDFNYNIDTLLSEKFLKSRIVKLFEEHKESIKEIDRRPILVWRGNFTDDYILTYHIYIDNLIHQYPVIINDIYAIMRLQDWLDGVVQCK